MIKLNNKNITYVALADSNNSLKAPKEIWYADSSNSVKLVYRRKDALIEGEDYEKYHWILTDTETPYIQVDNIYNTDNNAYIETTYKCKYTNGEFDMDIGFTVNQNNNIGIRIFNAVYCTFVDYHKTENGVLSSHRVVQSQSNINAERYIKATLNNLIIDTTEYPSIAWGSGFDSIRYPNTRLLANQGNNNVMYKRTKIRVNFKEYDLVPCKLLKPVPKWLDANGIRRQVGECGMIDLVSGKFYGNVNSVGIFTVENYYERKEWLVGDGSAYIDTNIIVDVPSLYISTSFTKKVNVEITSPLFGSRDTIYSNGSQIFYQNGKLRFDIITNGANWIIVDSSDIQNINQLIVDCPNKVININKITLSSGVDDLSIKNSSNTFKIYSLELLNSSDTNNVPYHGAFGNFTLNDSTHSLNLIPCTLTMDLPASMDANNIARTKGTSGMWDLVSDKFYGNVANSGTFKAVNLAEGVDYEVHQYLAVDMPRGHFMTLPLDSSNFSYQRVYTSIGNTAHLSSNREEYAYFSSNLIGIGIWNGSKTMNYASVNISNLSVVCDSNQLLFNSVEFPMYGFPPIVTFYNSSTATNTVLKQSAITIDGIERYIPVKLLKSIPSTYDANGIARQAGECGMYDTVNDVFYGNVASSGTFSVSDDS